VTAYGDSVNPFEIFIVSSPIEVRLRAFDRRRCTTRVKHNLMDSESQTLGVFFVFFTIGRRWFPRAPSRQMRVRMRRFAELAGFATCGWWGRAGMLVWMRQFR